MLYTTRLTSVNLLPTSLRYISSGVKVCFARTAFDILLFCHSSTTVVKAVLPNMQKMATIVR
jgi:hypothetical protein